MTPSMYPSYGIMAEKTSVVRLGDIQVYDSLIYVEPLVAVLDRKKKALRNKVVNLVKV